MMQSERRCLRDPLSLKIEVGLGVKTFVPAQRVKRVYCTRCPDALLSTSHASASCTTLDVWLAVQFKCVSNADTRSSTQDEDNTARLVTPAQLNESSRGIGTRSCTRSVRVRAVRASHPRGAQHVRDRRCARPCGRLP